MTNTLWQAFLGFYVAFEIKRPLCIELRVFRKKERKKKGLEVQKWLREASTNFRVWVAIENSLSRQSSQARCCNNGLWCRDTFGLGQARRATARTTRAERVTAGTRLRALD